MYRGYTDSLWKILSPSGRFAIDPDSGTIRRHHLHESVIQNMVKRAASASPINKQAGCYTLRQSYSTHLLEANDDIRTVQELLGDANVSAIMV